MSKILLTIRLLLDIFDRFFLRIIFTYKSKREKDFGYKLEYEDRLFAGRLADVMAINMIKNMWLKGIVYGK